jgi:hypothetical protein
MPQTQQFKDKLKQALNKFDLAQAEKLSDAIHEAEERGYVVTAAEERLWERLAVCIESYRRCSAALDG